jgi:hypothetical protein
MDSSSNKNEATLKRNVVVGDVEKDAQNNDQEGLGDYLTSIFDPAKIKALLYREEPKMATVPKPSLQLIGTTSALFLKDLVEVVLKTDEHNNDCLVTFDRLDEAVSSNPSFQFLRGAIDDFNEVNNKTNNDTKEYVPNASRKRRENKTSGSRLKKAKKLLKPSAAQEDWTGEEIQEAASYALNSSELVTSDQIVPDDDDYD